MSHSCSEGKEMFNNFARTVYMQSCCCGNLSLLIIITQLPFSLPSSFGLSFLIIYKGAQATTTGPATGYPIKAPGSRQCVVIIIRILLTTKAPSPGQGTSHYQETDFDIEFSLKTTECRKTKKQRLLEMSFAKDEISQKLNDSFSGKNDDHCIKNKQMNKNRDRRSKGRRGGGVGRVLAQHVFFWFYLHVLPQFVLGLHPTASSGTTQVFCVEFTLIDFFPVLPFYVSQHPFWRILQSTQLLFLQN